MQTETKGIVLRQYKMPGGRRMIFFLIVGKIMPHGKHRENRKGKSH